MPAASKTSKSKSQTTRARGAEPSHYVYVYCAVKGTVDAHALAGLARLPEGRAPRVLPLSDGIALIAADVPAAVYGADEVERRLSDLDWVGRCGSAHHAVADALAGSHTVVPLRPFTLFSSETSARSKFLELREALTDAFDRVGGKAEWVLRIGKPDRALKQDRPSARAAKPASGAAFLAQKAAARRAALDSADRVRSAADAVYDGLAGLASAAKRRRPEPATGLLVDGAFLVGQRHAARFKRTLQERAAPLLEAGCRVSLTGPWPPYSFVVLEEQNGE